jgi:hypothetical protein
LLSCAPAKPPLTADVTLRRDGSHFFGTIVRRDANSITVASQGGEARTFLFSDLSEMKVGATDPKTGPPVTPATPASPPPVPAGGELFGQPPGTQFAIRSNGFLDSCCLRLADIELGILDADIKSAQGVVMIPKGANVTFTVRDQSTANGRLSMMFELTSADFSGNHYTIASANGDSQPGPVMTVTGATEGSPEAAVRGKTIHLEDNSAMMFRAATPVIFKLSR